VIHICLSLQDTAFVQQWFVWVYFESMGKMAPVSLIWRKEVSGEMITVLANFLMFCHKSCKRVSVLWSVFSLCLQWGFVSFMDADGFWFFGQIWNIQFLIVDSAPNSFQVALNHNYWRILPTYEEICLVCIMVCSKFWSDYFVRINCWKPMSSMGGYGSLSLPFMIKGMLWHFFTQVSGSLQVTA
jgi:hypothetical protein